MSIQIESGGKSDPSTPKKSIDVGCYVGCYKEESVSFESELVSGFVSMFVSESVGETGLGEQTHRVLNNLGVSLSINLE